MKKLTFHDYMNFELPKFREEAVGRVSDSVEGGKATMKVKIRATHSGYLVNNRVYPGTNMKNSVHTWTKDYDRPVLLHHRSGSGWSEAVDPVGRVVGAKFHQLKTGKGFENDYKRPATDGMGSGYIIVEAEISDGDTIEKILDGRYQTVSSSQTTNQALCSICMGDWFGAGCDHWPGKKYTIGKGKKAKEYLCYIITGDLNYVELSFVNVPAQPKAQVLGALLNPNKDSEDEYQVETMMDTAKLTEITLQDSEGETDLLLPDGLPEATKTYVEMPGTVDKDLEEETAVLDTDGTEEQSESKEDATPETDPKEETETEPANENSDESEEETEPEVMSDEDFALAHVAMSLIDSDEFVSGDSEELRQTRFDGLCEEAEDHQHALYLMVEGGKVTGRTYSTVGSEAHDHVVEFATKDEVGVGETRDALSGTNHTHEFKLSTLTEVPAEDELQTLVATLREAADNVEDTRLTADQRTKLEKPKFCAPNRAFPVMDEHYVVAARALLSRYDGDVEAKARIRRKVETKAAQFGCPMDYSTDKKEEEEGTETKEQDQQGVKVLKELLDTYHEEKVLMKTELEHSKRTLDERNGEVERLSNELAKSHAERAYDNARTLVILRMITNKSDMLIIEDNDSFEERVKEYASREAASLRDSITDLLSEADVSLRSTLGGKHRQILVPNPEKPEPSPTLKHQDETNRGPNRPPQKVESIKSEKDGLDQDIQ